MPQLKDNPAPFSEEILEELALILNDYVDAVQHPIKLLDPFAGTGKIHQLATPRIKTFGVELEPEWAAWHQATEIGDALHLRWRRNTFNVVATSPVYPNRMTDHHNAGDGSFRRTYKHFLGRDPSEGSSTVLPWGPTYQAFHFVALHEMNRVLKPGGLLIINVSNHFKTVAKGEDPQEQMVCEWYAQTIMNMGYYLHEAIRVSTRRFRYGENYKNRVNGELIIVMRKPSAT